MKNIIQLLAFSLVLFIFSCAEKSSEIIGTWNLDKMDLSGEIISAKILGEPTYTFNKDKTYLITVSGQNEKGTWSLKDNEVHLYSKELDKKTVLRIQSISKDRFEYEIGDESVSKVYLKK